LLFYSDYIWKGFYSLMAQVSMVTMRQRDLLTARLAMRPVLRDIRKRFHGERFHVSAHRGGHPEFIPLNVYQVRRTGKLKCLATTNRDSAGLLSRNIVTIAVDPCGKIHISDIDDSKYMDRERLDGLMKKDYVRKLQTAATLSSHEASDYRVA
jgi:hypothetical protein